MYWANFLHVYQPAEQQQDILASIVTQSYRPLFSGFARQKNVRLTLNITGALLELLDTHGYRDLIDDLRRAGGEGRLEFTGSAKYHALLPFLRQDEVVRQVKLNNETNRYFLGGAYKPRGFFPPEMAYVPRLAKIVADLGFEWILLDEIAYSGQVGKIDYSQRYRIAGTKLGVYFRERRTSNLIMSAVVRSQKTLQQAMRADLRGERYLITAMDGETFGHHRPGLEKLLFQIFATKGFTLKTISELAPHYPRVVAVKPHTSTWASSEHDIERGIQFLSWSDPSNAIHAWQWKLLHLTERSVRHALARGVSRKRLRAKMDIALASDHFWWASAKPWWSVEMIEDGAYRLLDVLRSVPRLSKQKLALASRYYENIVSTAFLWQRTGKIRSMMREQMETLRIPFKERTLGRGGAERGVYYAFLTMMRHLEKRAAQHGEYEQAILWRDAIHKLEHKSDIYDAVNAIDLLRVQIPHQQVEKTIAQYKRRYQKIRGGQPEQRGG